MATTSPAQRRARQQLIGRAVALLQAQRHDAAAVLHAVLQRWPGQPDALHFLGVLAHRRGQGARAEALIREALEAAPDEAGIWNNLGNVLLAQSRHDEAEDAYRRCLALAPQSTDALANLAALHARRGERDEAVRLYRECQRRDPANPTYAHYLGACLDEPPQRASDDYVRRVFDLDADRFDHHLASLAYQAPEQLGALLRERLPAPDASLDIADLGCGTGLVGAHVRPWARRLVGCDLSRGMLDRCRARGGYDELVEAEMGDFLRRRPGGFDGLVCADTMIYVGDLHPVLAEAASALRPGGWLAMTGEALPDEAPQPLRLAPTGRYAHRADHWRGACAAAGLAIERAAGFTVRIEVGQPVAGWIAFVRRRDIALPRGIGDTRA